jgi:3-phenylpropionate/trans-cinnamate dioxygenase ferredoxin reductase subunit
VVIGSVTVVGASLAGVATVRALRGRGFDGRITVVGAEPHAPYDRPPLSKAFLTAPDEPRPDPLLQEGEELDVEWRLGVRAVALDPASRTVTLQDGTRLRSDAVVLATGARARRLPGTGGLPGVHVLRTLDDAVALRAQLAAGGSLVVVGAGFLGAEVASSACSLGLDVTVVEALATPLAGPLGVTMGTAVAGLHTDHGVHLRTGVGVARLLGDGHVEAVELADGTRLPADAVVVGIGAEPDVAWLADSGLDVEGGVRTDATCATAAPGVVAVGDCGLAYDVHAGRHLRAEHWTHALQQPATAAATLLGAPTPYAAVPYVWSEQYGVHVQLTGWTDGADEPTVVHGSTADRSFVATYERAGQLVAVLGVGAPGPFTKWRRSLRTAAAARLVAAAS